MDPRSGELYSQREMESMDDFERERLVLLRGKIEDIERLSEGIKALNREERRAANRKAGLRSNGEPK